MFPDYEKSIAFGKFRPFFLLVRAKCTWRWIWSNGGIVLAGENQITRKKNCFSAIWSTRNLTWNGVGSNPGLHNKNKLNDIYIYIYIYIYVVTNTTIFFVICLLLLSTITCFDHQCWPSSGCTWGTYQRVWGIYSLWGGVGKRSRFVLEKLWPSRTRMELQFHLGPALQLSTDLYDIYHCWVYSE